MPSCMGCCPGQVWRLAPGWARLWLGARRCVTAEPWRTVSSFGDRRLSEDKRGSLNQGQRLSSRAGHVEYEYIKQGGKGWVEGVRKYECKMKKKEEGKEERESVRQHLQSNQRSRNDYDHPWGEDLKVLCSEMWVWPSNSCSSWNRTQWWSCSMC